MALLMNEFTHFGIIGGEFSLLICRAKKQHVRHRQQLDVDWTSAGCVCVYYFHVIFYENMEKGLFFKNVLPASIYVC